LEARQRLLADDAFVRVSKMSRSSSRLTSGGREEAVKVRKKEAPNEFAYERYVQSEQNSCFVPRHLT
jgi:hypothetical protein